MKTLKYVISCVASFALAACGTFGLYSGDSSELVATVGDAELRSSALEHIYSGTLSVEDSVKVREAFVAAWIRSEIKRQEAEKVLEGEDAKDVERMTKEYRAQLLTYKFENDYIAAHIDTTITDAQISEYYKANSDNFRLAGPLVKACVVRIPSGLRQSKRLEEMFRSDKKSTTEDFMNICQKNNYRIDDFSSQWTDFALVLQHLPFPQKNFDEFLEKSKFYDVSDDEWRYMMRIDQYMLSGELSPEDREREVIIKILKNLRRGDLLRTLDDSLYRRAQAEHLIKIETNQ
ncbi:MAG: hypothetical protein RR752_00720 [Mucinivorans sp.]